jgi:hypothetical protein
MPTDLANPGAVVARDESGPRYSRKAPHIAGFSFGPSPWIRGETPGTRRSQASIGHERFHSRFQFLGELRLSPGRVRGRPPKPAAKRRCRARGTRSLGDLEGFRLRFHSWTGARPKSGFPEVTSCEWPQGPLSSEQMASLLLRVHSSGNTLTAAARALREPIGVVEDARVSSQSATRFATRVAAARHGTRLGVAVHVHPLWGRPIAQTAGTGRRSSTSTLPTENPPSRSRSASSFPRSRARSGAEWRASQKM